MITVIGDVLLVIIPIIGTWLWEPDYLLNFKWDIGHIVAIVIGVLYLGYLSLRIITIYKISDDKIDAYRKQFMEQVDNVMLNKYHKLCKASYHQPKETDVLLYDAHDVVNDILTHIKQLISNITGVSLSNISTNFIYRYIGENEHWQTIDGSASCSIGSLDKLVTEEDTVYHYLYANNREYVFYNNKSDDKLRCYRPSIRDGEDKKEWGSIYCKRILCTMHQDRIVDGIIAISTYNEKFTVSKRKKIIKQTEGLINEAISVFENLIRTEMVSLYIRHNTIKERQLLAINVLNHNEEPHSDEKKDFSDEQVRIEEIQSKLPTFKRKYNQKYPSFFTYDDIIDQKTLTALDYARRNSRSKKTVRVLRYKRYSRE